MLKIFINTWGNYNENGADGGKWITLPMDEDELDEILDKVAEDMGDHDPEWFINDYEWEDDFHIEVSEHENIRNLNQIAEELDNLDKWDRFEALAAVEAFGYDIEEAISKQSRGYFTFYAHMTLEEVAEEIINECYDLPEFALRYFDYEAFARDLGFDGYHETEWGVIVE